MADDVRVGSRYGSSGEYLYMEWELGYYTPDECG